ncbi:hypothetical protein [Nostoc sp. 'Peltigera membranacea cyanobiont' 210A]|uniref:hypothetical protein n=1 Tax=Nostoc sp. 'Peltigera membranacea cyanobiont' 210A TaxID=2014529 RepID=UPI00117ECA1D|nr:hypothetical protein [Nostoc sp. 'Peltigera membranacea cyanobiont' 210A]
MTIYIGGYCLIFTQKLLSKTRSHLLEIKRSQNQYIVCSQVKNTHPRFLRRRERNICDEILHFSGI